MLFNFKKIITFICAAIVLTNGCAYSYNSGFSDDFFNILKKKEKPTQKMLDAKEELKRRKIPASVDSFIKYVKKNDTEVMQIFTDAGFNVNTDFFTDYPIYYAAKGQKYEAVKFLLEHGADPNLGFNTPLIEAINKKNAPIAKLLMDYGAKVNEEDFVSGRTLLYTALKKGQYEIARELIKHGAKVDTGSKFIIEEKNLYDTLELDKSSFY